ncbi:MAG TPA: GNAT family N-acetyltransferase, partial [Clostridia bacterium]|nr:GNAT family N-acetyltransferase [Clostridia bacterium]
FLSWTPHVLVAKQGGKPVGAALLKTYPLPDGRKGGFIAWIFTDPDARGLGAGQRLVEASLDSLQSMGCAEIAACVEGHNTSSSKLFSTRGFSILSPGNQFKRYGLRILPTWFHMFHFMDIGHFVWASPGPSAPDRPALQWWGTLLLNSLITLLAVFRGGSVSPLSFAMVPLLYLLLLGARQLAMKGAAAAQGLAVRYRTWESGLLLSFGIALVLGGLFPIPGSIYPTSDSWSYRTLRPKLGKTALAGILPTLLIAASSWALIRFADLPQALLPWIGYAKFISANLAFFDILLPFFPFASFNGRRLWDWNRLLWAVPAALTLGVFFF